MGAYIINVPSTVDRVVYTNVDPMNGKTYIASYSVDDLTPYTEPDLDQVRKEAKEEGYRIGYDEGREAGVQQGLADAWEAARKIADMPYGEEEKAFGSGGWAFIVKHTASEAIEKIRQYEQRQEEQDGLRQNIQTIVDKCGYSLDEIATVLEKMRGEQDG